MADRRSDFISLYRQYVTEFLTIRKELVSLREEYDSGDFGNTLENGTRNDADPEHVRHGHFHGGNADITLTQLTLAVSTVEAIENLLQQGHLGNLQRIRL